MATIQPPILKDKPVLEEGLLGYFHNTDATRLPPNCLTYPSINGFIPNKDKFVPRPGKTLVGQRRTTGKNWPIIGNKERFATMSGAVVEIRVTMTDDADLKDVIEVLYPNPADGIPRWYQMTENVNPLTPAPGKLGMRARYWFDDWFDTNLNPALSLNLPRLIGVNGTTQIISSTVGIAPVVSIVPGTSITTTAGTSWTALGFVSPSLGGSGSIILNGKAYSVSDGWDTDTLLLSDTTGISVNDVAISQFQVDAAPIAFDVCRQNKNYMFYGSWTSRRFFQSNGFGHDSMLEITAVQAVQNDLVIVPSPYTGTGEHVYRVTIDSVNPPLREQTFISGGSGNLNDGVYNSSVYSGIPGFTNIYSVLIVGDAALITTLTSGAFAQGETVKGSISNAEGIIVYILAGAGSTRTLGLAMLTNNGFQSGDTLTGLSSGATATMAASSNTILADNFFTLMKNGVVVNTNTGAGSRPVSVLINSGPITLTDRLTISFANNQGHAVGDSFQLTINQGGADTFQWQIDGAAPVATMVPITGGTQILSEGVEISFVSTTGHTLGDYWEITADQEVSKAWTNFYYTLPVRKPGEGYIYRLPSNFWTMEPQEEEMYVNTQYGQWSYVSTVLSSDLQSETVSLTPLKQTATSKVIFPYMVGHDDNNLTFITTNKKLESIGRREFVQLPQIGYLSQPVELDFQAATFENGSMKYLDKRQYITSPNDVGMLVYDNQEGIKYWQPPQEITENGILTIIEDALVSHSNLRNQTFELFNGTSDDGAAYTVRMRMPYNSYGDRWQMKNSSYSFIEGYISGVPPLILSVYLGVNGCGGIFPHIVQPIVCALPDRAPDGQGPLGSHSFGNDIYTTDKPYFSEAYNKFSDILSYYFSALEMECTTSNHSYEILSLGLNAIDSLIGNTGLVPDEFVSPD